MNKIKTSIIIPHFNGIEIIDECLSSLANMNDNDYEIIVVDNNSTDQSINHIKKNFKKIRIIELTENKGYAGGCNVGAQSAKGNYLVFLNNDTIHENDWLEKLTAYMDSNKNVASCQPKIMNYFNREYFDYAGGSGGFLDLFTFPFCRGRILSQIEKDENQYDNIRDIFWASGTAFITRKDIFLEAGGFDETLFAHMEEIDYHWKCHWLGYHVSIVPSAIIYHKNAQTLKKESSYKKFLNHRNSLILLITHYNFPFNIILLTPRLILECISIIKEIITLQFHKALANIASLFWILINPVYLIKKYFSIKRIKQKSIWDIFNKLYLGSIVVGFYVFNKKSFSNLNHE